MTKSFCPSIRRGSSQTNASRKYRGRNTVLVVGAIFIILMIGTLPMAHAFKNVTAYTPVFWRQNSSGGCDNLGNNIQARFEPDNSTGAMTIKAVGTQAQTYSNNNGTGDFRFDEQADGQDYYVGGNGPYEPATEAYGNFRGYEIVSVNITYTEPLNGGGSAPVTGMLSQAVSYNSNYNFSSGGWDEFEWQISQSSTYIWTNYSIISSSGTVLKEWSIAKDTSGVGQPYSHFAVTSQIDGLDNEGYAVVNSGTDFRIESVIPSAVTDFTSHEVLAYTSPFTSYNVPPSGTTCITTSSDDEGDSATYNSVITNVTSNEAYQYYDVS
ncbi:MAG: hypothetical protein JRN58_03195 [Nitrososphaerota archaeon]|nr:hypothetical protein [Nitrososphaerota archaeon]MDG6978065.1 hypothetical protein [Nitrososphaerota archaeon]